MPNINLTGLTLIPDNCLRAVRQLVIAIRSKDIVTVKQKYEMYVVNNMEKKWSRHNFS